MKNTAPAEDAPRQAVLKSAGIVSLAVTASRVTGLARETIMASLFGASAEYEAFLLGFRIPNLTRDLFAEGALSSAFVPTFTEYLAKGNKEDAARLANLVATAIILVVGTLCALGMIFAPQLVNLAASGLHNVPGKFELGVRMTRIMFPFLLLVALAAQAMGVLNACNKFGVPAMSSTLFNIGSITAGVTIGYGLGPWIGVTPIEGMAMGVVIGGLLQLAFQLPSLYRLGFRFVPRVDWADPGLQRILHLMGPAILGNAAVQVNVLVNSNFAFQIADAQRGFDGPVAWLNAAFRFMQLPLGVFGVAIGSATLASISRSAAAGNMEEFRQTVSHSLGTVFLLTIPSSIGLAVLGRSIIGAIYEHGAFEAYDTERTAVALAFFAIGLSGYAALKVLVPAFYALGDSRTPMMISVASVAINAAVASFVVGPANLGLRGLALATSIVALFGFFAQFLILRNRLDGIHGRALLTQVGKIAAASASMAVVAWTSSYTMHRLFSSSHRAYWGDVLVSIPLAAAVYYGMVKRLGFTEVDMVLNSFLGPLRRRLQKS